MFKKFAVVSILLISLMFVSSPAKATPTSSCPSVLEYAWEDDYGFLAAYYSIAGNIKLSITFRDYVSASITLPKIENLAETGGEWFLFWPVDSWEYGYFGDTLLYSMSPELFEIFGEWEQYNCDLYLDVAYLAYMLEDMLASYEGSGGVTTATKFKAKVAKDGTHSGKITIKIRIDEPLPGDLSLTMSFKSYPVLINDPKVKKDRATMAANIKKNQSALKSEIRNFIGNVMTNLPKKGVAPKK